MEITHGIGTRYSTRKFVKEIIHEGLFLGFVESASAAPSAFNEQPWRFIAASRQNDEEFRLLASLLDAGNAWANDASHLVLVYAETKLARNGKVNFHALYDTGGAVALFSLAAIEQGVYVHQMGGYDSVRARTELGLSPDQTSICMLALGYVPDEMRLSPDEVKKKRKRRPVNELLRSVRQ